MRVWIVNASPDEPKAALVAQTVKKLDCDVGWLKSMEEAAGNVATRQPTRSLVIVPATPQTQTDVRSLIEQTRKLTGRAFVLYIADEISPADYKALLRTGSADSTDWKSAVKDIAAVVNRLKNRDAADDDQYGRPSEHSVISFLGTGGGPGNTTLAIEVGVMLAELKRKEGRQVALFDLDFDNSMMCDYLDLTPRVDFDALAHDPHRLDDYMLDVFVSRHGSGLHVLSPRQPVNAAGIEKAVIFQLLNKLLDNYDTVLIDLPHHRIADNEEILQNSDLVLVSGWFSVPAVNRLRLLLQYLQKLGLARDRIAAILTGADTGILGGTVERFNVDHLLGDLPYFCVRRDPAFALECADAGQSMVETQPRRGTCRDLRAIAEHIVSMRPALVV